MIVVSMLYMLRKRKWLVRKWRLARWLWLHHWVGFFGGVLAIFHTLANIQGLGLAVTIVLVLVLSSSGIYLVERRLRRPLTEKAAELQRCMKERGRLDAAYRDLLARGYAASQQGIDIYNSLLAEHASVQGKEVELEEARGKAPSLGWWIHIHNVGTMMLVGFLLVHIWSKLYFAWGGL